MIPREQNRIPLRARVLFRGNVSLESLKHMIKDVYNTYIDILIHLPIDIHILSVREHF
jgi:hypothetical protein